MQVPTDNSYKLAGIIAMRGGIIAAEVGKILRQSELLTDHDEGALLALRLGPDVLGANDQSEFEWHVEAREVVNIELDARQVMDRVTAFADQLYELRKTDLGAVPVLQGAASDVTAGRDCKHKRCEARQEFLVEGAIDKDVSVRFTQALRDGFENRSAAPCGPP